MTGKLYYHYNGTCEVTKIVKFHAKTSETFCQCQHLSPLSWEDLRGPVGTALKGESGMASMGMCRDLVAYAMQVK